MLRFINSFTGVAVMSLRNGRAIAKIDDPIINPNNLSVEAFYLTTKVNDVERVVFTGDIRELSPQGIIVDSEDSLMELDGLVRLEELLEINFQLIDKKVETKSGKTVGKVSDYVVDDKGFVIQKIYVRPTVIKTFTQNDLIIGRRQIVEVTDSKVVVKDTDIKSRSRSKRPSFNPIAQ